MGLQLPGEAMNQEEFLKTKGFVCPFCKTANSPTWDTSMEIQGDENDNGQEIVRVRTECDDCHATWDELYVQYGYEQAPPPK